MQSRAWNKEDKGSRQGRVTEAALNTSRRARQYSPASATVSVLRGLLTGVQELRNEPNTPAAEVRMMTSMPPAASGAG